MSNVPFYANVGVVDAINQLHLMITYMKRIEWRQREIPPAAASLLLLGKEGYVFGSVGLSVYFLVSNITQKVMNGL